MSSPTPPIDLNSDLGEGFGSWRMADDDALLEMVTSANVACGFHAGDPATMHRVCRRAVEHGVLIGAHVGYRDLAGFGRRHIDVDPDELTDEVLYQIGALDAFARRAGDRVRYVKPHGALYTTAATDDAQAAAVVRAVVHFDPSIAVLGLPGSSLLRHAQQAGADTVAEAFADRAYRPDGTLLPRGRPGAVLHDVEAVVRRAVRLATESKLEAVDGTVLHTAARSICVHGDTPEAVRATDRIRSALAAAGVPLSGFAKGAR